LFQEAIALRERIDAAGTLFRRTLLMTLYATGMRRSELARLKSAISIASGWSSAWWKARAARIVTCL
jgi:site-specific recombinase XerD